MMDELDRLDREILRSGIVVDCSEPLDDRAIVDVNDWFENYIRSKNQGGEQQLPGRLRSVPSAITTSSAGLIGGGVVDQVASHETGVDQRLQQGYERAALDLLPAEAL